MDANSRKRIVMTGVILGGLLGGVFAWLSSDRAEESDTTAIHSMGPSEYFQLAIGVLTLARQFQSMLQRKE